MGGRRSVGERRRPVLPERGRSGGAAPRAPRPPLSPTRGARAGTGRAARATPGTHTEPTGRRPGSGTPGTPGRSLHPPAELPPQPCACLPGVGNGGWRCSRGVGCPRGRRSPPCAPLLQPLTPILAANPFLPHAAMARGHHGHHGPRPGDSPFPSPPLASLPHPIPRPQPRVAHAAGPGTWPPQPPGPLLQKDEITTGPRTTLLTRDSNARAVRKATARGLGCPRATSAAPPFPLRGAQCGLTAGRTHVAE